MGEGLVAGLFGNPLALAWVGLLEFSEGNANRLCFNFKHTKFCVATLRTSRATGHAGSLALGSS